MINIVRKFRFSLLGLIIFTAVVAVGTSYWFAPFEIELPAKDCDQYGFDETFFISDGRPNLDVAKTILLRVRRNLRGGYDPLGPIVCRYENDHYSLYTRKTNQNVLPIGYTNLPVGPKFHLGNKRNEFAGDEYAPSISVMAAIGGLNNEGR
jgi:hypothetical protein